MTNLNPNFIERLYFRPKPEGFASDKIAQTGAKETELLVVRLLYELVIKIIHSSIKFIA